MSTSLEREPDAAATAVPPAPAGPAAERGIGRAAARRILPTAVYIGVLLLVGYVVFTGVERLLQVNSVNARIAQTEAEIHELELEAAKLEALAAWFASDAYVERIAREDLGMVYPGEQAFTVHSASEAAPAVRRSPWWKSFLPEEALAADP